MWLLGCIADQYRSVARGEVKNRRKVLLGTQIATMVISALVLALCIVILFSILSVGLSNLENMDEIAAAEMVSSLLVPMVGMLLLCLPLLVLAIVHTVFYYIALHDLFSSCDPRNATLYLVLSIFIQITLPIFLMICRNQDDGMPARQQPVYQTPVDPWQGNM
jgi:ABC-type multidrug transport system permease subunit